MANPSIGGIEFIVMRGPRPVNPAERVGEITRPRVDGHAFERLGKRGQPVTLQTEVDVSNVSTAFAAYLALQSTFVTVVDPDGQSFSNVLVLGVAKVASKKVLTPQGGVNGGDWMLTAQWQLQPTNV